MILFSVAPPNVAKASSHVSLLLALSLTNVAKVNKPLKYLQQTTFSNCLFRWMLKQKKVAQNISIFLATSFCSKKCHGLSKVAQFAKNCSIWSP